VATLLIRDPDGQEREVPLPPDRALVAGRVEGNDLVLPGRLVSRRHASFSIVDGVVQVEDLQSANGTRVDDEPLTGTRVVVDGGTVAIGEYVVVVRNRPGRDAGAPGPRGSFAALDGPDVGKRVAFDVGGGTVGRVIDNALVIDDVSVSRRHARIEVRGDDLWVRDLGSSNGTFVNSERVEERVLAHGDEVRFGSRPYRYERQGGGPLPGTTTSVIEGRERRAAVERAAAPVSGSAARRRLIRVLVGVVAVVLVVGTAVRVLRGGGDPAPRADASRGATAQEPGFFVQMDRQVSAAIERGRAAEQSDDWETALREYQTALDVDPIHAEARNLVRRARREKEMKAVYREGEMNHELGKLREAREAYLRIPRESAYYVKVKYKLREIGDRIGKQLVSEAKGLYSADHFDRAYEKYCEYLQIFPTDEKVLRGLKSCEDNLRRLRMRYTPCEIPEPARAGDGEERGGEDALAARYAHAPTREAVRKYVEGDWDSALRALKRIAQGKGGDATLAEQIAADMVRAQGHQVAGTTRLLEGDVAAAQAEWQKVLAFDAAVLPVEVRSHVAQELRRQLGDAHYRRGLPEFDKGRYEEAFAAWSAGYQVNPDHIDLLKGMARLEKVAADLDVEARELAGAGDPRAGDLYRKIARMTRPDSPLHRQAAERAGAP
jgi:pSer/pThr/pTyr-binding forkhead associated (FHA) protein/tetratricopeptide (TPR) repeat protein